MPKIIPMPGQELVSVSKMVVGAGEYGFQDGAAAAAMFRTVDGMLQLPDGRVLVSDYINNRIRVLSADLQQVSTMAGDGEQGHRDGAAAQAQFLYPATLALLPDGRVLVADSFNSLIRILSADLQQVSTVADNGGPRDRNGAAAEAQFDRPSGLALLPDGRVLVAEEHTGCIRALSADLQQVSTVAGDGWTGHQDGAAAQAQFRFPSGLAVLPDGRVLVTDYYNKCIRMLSTDLHQVSTVAGNGEKGHRDGAAAHAQFLYPCGLTLLPDSRVLVIDDQYIRVLSADLQQVTTLTNADTLVNADELDRVTALALLLDGRLLMSTTTCIHVLDGFQSKADIVWERRRILLMCLLRFIVVQGIDVSTDAPSDVLLRVAALPEELWKGPSIFQYL